MTNKQQIDKFLDACQNDTLSAEQKAALKRALQMADMKVDAWKTVEQQCAKPHISVVQMLHRTMRYAAILLPFLVIGLVWAGDIRDFIVEHIEAVAHHNAPKAAEAISTSSIATMQFEDANMQMVVDELLKSYPQIHGVRGNIVADTVRITTSFDNQTLDEVFEELNIHFDKKIALSDDGYLTISD